MKKFLFCIFFCTVFSRTYSQNLVLNPSFEDYNRCCSRFDMYSFPFYNCVNNWTLPSWGDSNFFCKCFDTCLIYQNDTNFTVPLNWFGYQQPHSGNNYAGFGGFVINYSESYREYIQGELVQPLNPGKKYLVTYYLSLAESSNCAISNLGVFFSVNANWFAMQNNIPLMPQVINLSNNFIVDTINWVKITGEYIATGREKFFIIGNFNNNQNTDTVIVKYPLPTIFNATYYYIDDVSVVFNDTIYKANAGQDAIICRGESVTIGTHNFNDYQYRWYPSTGLNNDTLANPIASPSITTTYILELKDFFDTLTYDTVVVQVIPCTDAGPDQSICLGSSIQLGTHDYDGYTYYWSPITGLDNPQIARPYATPPVSITYTLQVTDLLQQISTDAVSITVKDCDSTQKVIKVPNVFTPNKDGFNDLLEIENLTPNCKLQIFNRWGKIVYESNDYQNNWDGGYVAEGVYYYVITTAEGKQKQGVVHIVR